MTVSDLHDDPDAWDEDDEQEPEQNPLPPVIVDDESLPF